MFFTAILPSLLLVLSLVFPLWSSGHFILGDLTGCCISRTFSIDILTLSESSEKSGSEKELGYTLESVPKRTKNKNKKCLVPALGSYLIGLRWGPRYWYYFRCVPSDSNIQQGSDPSLEGNTQLPLKFWISLAGSLLLECSRTQEETSSLLLLEPRVGTQWPEFLPILTITFNHHHLIFFVNIDLLDSKNSQLWFGMSLRYRLVSKGIAKIYLKPL